MATASINPLEPERIGGLYGRPSSLVSWSILSGLRPKTRAAMASLTVLAAAVALTVYEGAFSARTGPPSLIALLLKPHHKVDQVGLSLLQDPVGPVVLVLALATPIFCAAQVGYIAMFNSMNEGNIAYRVSKLNAPGINTAVARANHLFDLVGRRVASVLLLVACGAESFVLDLMLRRHGLLQSWNGSTLTATTWRHMAYDGWWANPSRHLDLAIVLWLVGAYYFYFLQKQLAMGAIFARYVHGIMRFEFGVTPNVQYNTDGYWGLRPLRHFMQWTYCSMLCDFTLTLSVFMVWFPFSAWTVFIELCVIVINFTVVLYPSMLAQGGSIIEKKLYVDHLIGSNRPRAEREGAIDAVWTRPNLPFHIRSTLTAATIYLFIPLGLALVSSLVPR